MLEGQQAKEFADTFRYLAVSTRWKQCEDVLIQLQKDICENKDITQQELYNKHFACVVYAKLLEQKGPVDPAMSLLGLLVRSSLDPEKDIMKMMETIKQEETDNCLYFIDTIARLPIFALNQNDYRCILCSFFAFSLNNMMAEYLTFAKRRVMSTYYILNFLCGNITDWKNFDKIEILTSGYTYMVDCENPDAALLEKLFELRISSPNDLAWSREQVDILAKSILEISDSSEILALFNDVMKTDSAVTISFEEMIQQLDILKKFNKKKFKKKFKI